MARAEKSCRSIVSRKPDFHDVAELPDGRGLLITVHRLQGPDTIAVVADGKRQNVIRIEGESLRSPVYSPAGTSSTRVKQQIPASGRCDSRCHASPQRASLSSSPLGGATPSLAADGTLALVRPSDQPAELISIDRQGSVTPITRAPCDRRRHTLPIGPCWAASADRQKFAVMLRAGGGQDLFTYDAVRRTVTRVSQGTGAGANPTWSTDGRRIFFASFAGGRVWNIYAVSSTESSRPERVLPPSDQMQWPCSVSPDGRLILYAEGMDSTTDLWVAPLDGSAAPQRVTNTPFREMDGKFSPDGKLDRVHVDGIRPRGGVRSIVSDCLGSRYRFPPVAERSQPGLPMARRFSIEAPDRCFRSSW